MTTYFNNCRNRDHVKHYGPGAFYDLYTTGSHAALATNLEPGSECLVATQTARGEIILSYHRFSHEALMPDEEGLLVRVFFGECVRTETRSKVEAARTEPYSVFFNSLGHFKQQSVL